ncbi:glycosyltransferase family 4 protein [Halovivax limisalsi]|uniref:glycosyltransferase family 4 protein n=1 Tax=Halovivax limisalsi TaxID=1453760 RepID=UPI001FFC68E3|nr:glycosyltransferase family 4 protein [Halovivax limisalsi]
MRICLLSDGYPPWDAGGAQTITARLAEGYVDNGHDAHVITTVDDRADRGRSIENGVVVHRVWTPRPRCVLPYLTLRNPLVADALPGLLTDIAPDVVHAHNVHYLSNESLRIADERGLPVVKTFHDAGTVSYGELTTVADRAPDGFADDADAPALPDSAYKVSPVEQALEQKLRYVPIRNPANRRCLSRCVDVGIAVSRALRRGLAVNGVDCSRVIHNGVDAARFDREADVAAPAEAEFRRRHGLGDGPFVCFAGRTSYEKGAAHLAAAFADLVENRGAESENGLTNARLLVTGDDSYVADMRRIAGPAADRIVATGWIPRPALRTALRSARVVASPAVYLDPFPTVNLEAFAAGTPVVTTAFGGASELVDDGVDGRIVDPRDVRALADALGPILGDADRASACGASGREKVRDRFTLDAQVEAYLEVLEAVRWGQRPPDEEGTTPPHESKW